MSMTRETSPKGMRLPSSCSKIIKPAADLLLGEGVEGRAKTLQAGAQGRGVAADADPEMPRHFEEATGDNGGFIFFAKQFEKSVGIAVRKPETEPGKNHRSGRGTKAFDVAPRIEKGIEQGAIGGQQRAGAFPKLFQMAEGHDREALGGMGPGGGKQIVEEPHAAGQVWSRQNPTAAQPAEAVNFREAAGNDERIFVGAGDRVAEGKTERRGLAEEHLEVHLVHQHTHAGAMRHLADGL